MAGGHASSVSAPLLSQARQLCRSSTAAASHAISSSQSVGTGRGRTRTSIVRRRCRHRQRPQPFIPDGEHASGSTSGRRAQIAQHRRVGWRAGVGDAQAEVLGVDSRSARSAGGLNLQARRAPTRRVYRRTRATRRRSALRARAPSDRAPRARSRAAPAEGAPVLSQVGELPARRCARRAHPTTRHALTREPPPARHPGPRRRDPGSGARRGGRSRSRS